MTRRREGAIAIVEIALMSPLGASLRQTCDALLGEECGVRPGVSLEQTPARPAGIGEVPLDVGAPTSASRGELLLRSTLGQLSALERTAPGDAPALVLGTTVAGMRHCGDAIRHESAGQVDLALSAICRMPAAAVLDRAASGFPIGPMRISLSCACASALSAIVHACALIRASAVSWAIAGGYDPISEFTYGGFSALQLVASGALSPFSADREGMKLGEGCALYVLRPLSEALRLGERPIGVIEAIGESSDSHHLTQPHPQGRGAAAALAAACEHGAPDLLIAHATGTPGNDAAEYEAYRVVFGDLLPTIAVTALKSRFGHPLGAAGALELGSALACADRGVLPAGVGRGPDGSRFPDLRLLRGRSPQGDPRRVVALAAGFGGANVALSVVRGVEQHTVEEMPPVAAVAGDGRDRDGLDIVGIGAVSAGGRGIAGLRTLSEVSPQPVPDDVIAPLLDRAKTRRLALLPRLMLAAVRDLVEQTGMQPADLKDVPVLAASWHGAIDFTERYYRDLIASGIDLANPMLFAESVPNIGSAHLSLGFGIQAPSASVVGSRTGGLQALALAMARLSSGMWDRALIVAAEECHPTIGEVLGWCLGERVREGSAAIALLVGRDQGSAGGVLLTVWPGRDASPTEATTVISASPCEAGLRSGAAQSRPMPELGAATPFALLVTELYHQRGGVDRPFIVACGEPSGTPWFLKARGRTG